MSLLLTCPSAACPFPSLPLGVALLVAASPLEVRGVVFFEGEPGLLVLPTLLLSRLAEGGLLSGAIAAPEPAVSAVAASPMICPFCNMVLAPDDAVVLSALLMSSGVPVPAGEALKAAMLAAASAARPPSKVWR